MFFEVVGEIARAGAFVARDVEVVASECAIGKMNSGIGAVHPCAAKPAAPQNDRSIALPISRIAVLAADCEVHGRRTLPFPLAQKFI